MTKLQDKAHTNNHLSVERPQNSRLCDRGGEEISMEKAARDHAGEAETDQTLETPEQQTS